jgi:colanic acid/amylovoran biosynthesis glycosyltransferase
VGVSWPPEPFLQRSFESLAARGIRVVVASATRGAEVAGALPGIEMERLPAEEERRLAMLLDLARASVRLALTHPRRLLALLARVSAPPRYRSRRARLWKKVDLLRTHVSLARLDPDIAHFEWESAALNNLPLFDLWGCPIVMSCHGSGIYVDPHTPHGSGRVSELRTAFRGAAAVRCVCNAIREEAIGYGLERGKARVIRSAVDTDFFRPPEGSTASAVLRVVAVGNVRWVKGHDFALQAVRELINRGREVALDLVGDGPDRDRVRYAIQDLGLDEHVRLHGTLDPSGVRRILQRADALLQPSLSEGGGPPTVVLEAMACGLPVVVTGCGGVREAIEDGVHGLVVPPRDSRAMAAALGRLQGDSALRERMGRAGRALVQSTFQLQRQTDELLSLYQHVAGRNGAAAA